MAKGGEPASPDLFGEADWPELPGELGIFFGYLSSGIPGWPAGWEMRSIWERPAEVDDPNGVFVVPVRREVLEDTAITLSVRTGVDRETALRLLQGLRDLATTAHLLRRNAAHS